ncbi:LacI family DNA-binding transcriptional regulator [Amycolatopsis rhizosphaerae]|uniref:LacI family DNA-binding transcriptional regulator n=1 Tax=Amycolatopsis rhizosphaerae TaxID=2053003 RepID=A0A558AGH8_9PSEU|nr:LacI family DNA-binding transcriptional regulator [Amycolatopsis rhizosphaerae]TVT23370.1 LacI family DNA-binding transcriptional regulator [Amycolatopsis rhizosphaerae]
MTEPVRLTDIAELAKVSEATVSRVVNGKAGVAAATRQAVLAAMDQLGYDRPARSRQRNAGLIGLIIPELNNPIFPAFAQVIDRTLTLRGFTSVLCTQSPGAATEDELIEALTERGVDGIVFVSGLHADQTASRDRYTRLITRGLPVVFVNGYAPDVKAPFFSDDDAAAVQLAIAHLRELGHERIGLAVGPSRFVPSRRKAEEFRRLMAPVAGEAEVERLLVNSLYSVEGGHSAASFLLDEGCTAMVCGSDLMALGAIRGARKRGLSVPRDFSVIGYDDSPLIAFTDPPLTTIQQQVSSIAAAAVRALLDEIAGLPVPSTEYLFQPELIVRGSTAACPSS